MEGRDHEQGVWQPLGMEIPKEMGSPPEPPGNTGNDKSALFQFLSLC